MLVVTNGPVAIAGSISSFLKAKGVNVPTPVAIIIDEHMLKPTTTPIIGLVSIKRNQAKTPSIIPYKTPRIKPALSSFNIVANSFPIVILPVAMPLTIIVEDCVPIFPPMPIIIGIKEASTIMFSRRFSKLPIT